MTQEVCSLLRLTIVLGLSWMVPRCRWTTSPVVMSSRCMSFTLLAIHTILLSSGFSQNFRGTGKGTWFTIPSITRHTLRVLAFHHLGLSKGSPQSMFKHHIKVMSQAWSMAPVRASQHRLPLQKSTPVMLVANIFANDAETG